MAQKSANRPDLFGQHAVAGIARETDDDGFLRRMRRGFFFGEQMSGSRHERVLHKRESLRVAPSLSLRVRNRHRFVERDECSHANNSIGLTDSEPREQCRPGPLVAVAHPHRPRSVFQVAHASLPTLDPRG